MFKIGVDSAALEKEYTSQASFNQQTGELTPPTKIVTKALFGASVTTQDIDFNKKYQEVLHDSLQKHGIRQDKLIYKASHLIKQIKGKYDEVFTDVLNAMESSIEHIDLYHATYLHEDPSNNYISVFGKAQGQRLTPLEYIEKNKNGFEQACTWWNWRIYSKQESDYCFCLDHFESKLTPAWKELESNKVNIKVFYSGCECNSLISFADLILKEIETFHFGAIDYVSIAQPIRNKAKTYALGQKIKSYNLSKTDWVIRQTVPEIPLDIDLIPYVKHPVYFIAWTPALDLSRKIVKPSFELSKFYNSVMRKAIETDGCVKFLDFSGDMNFWEDADFIIPWENPDLEHVRQLQTMGFPQMPKILNATDLTT
jgi:hypothetical protein